MTTQELTRKQLRELEAELLGERARLERSLDMQRVGDGRMSPALGDVPHVHASEGGGTALALATRTQVRYAAVLDALTRIADGTYGACAGCDGRIAFGRLLVMPETTRCVACGLRL